MVNASRRIYLGDGVTALVSPSGRVRIFQNFVDGEGEVLLDRAQVERLAELLREEVA